LQEKFENIKGVIKNSKSKNIQYNAQKIKDKRKMIYKIYKTLCRKLNIEQHKPPMKTWAELVCS
jgi:hypothetical protein